MIELDGATGEGGGQILRTALALSMCTGQSFRLHHIRAKRSKPGLMRQHLACVHAARDICGASVIGAVLGATELEFRPGVVTAGDYSFAIAGAGSTLLVLQTVLPALMQASASSTIKLVGGTHNPMAPSFHFIERAFAPFVRLLGVDMTPTLRRCGFYPAGGGEFDVVIAPTTRGLKSIDLSTRGALVDAYAEALVAGVPTAVAKRELDALGRELQWRDEQLRTLPLRQNVGPGNALLATLQFENVTEVFCELGERGVAAETVAKRLAKRVRAYMASDAPVAEHLADQLMLLLAINGGGRYRVTTVTEHARTNARVIERFLPVTISTAEVAAGGWFICVSVDAMRASSATATEQAPAPRHHSIV